MGTPMALRLSRKYALTAWNRSPTKYDTLRKAGAQIAQSPSEVAKSSDVIFTMLFNEKAFDDIWTPSFDSALKGKVLVNTSSVSVEYSHRLANKVTAAGGEFIEMPVSGSKVPAEQGTLVGMLAGDSSLAQRIQPLFEPITASTIYCGGIGMGLKTKYAVNSYLITLTAGLAEAANLAKAQGLDLEAFGKVLEAGPTCSPYMNLKMDKILQENWAPQAAIKDCYNSTLLIQEAAKKAGTAVPLLALCSTSYAQAVQAGLGEEDMIAVAKVFESGGVKSSDSKSI